MASRKLSTPKRRLQMRDSLWPESGAIIFPAEREKGWFSAPRTLPLILMLLDDKRLSGNMDLSRTYLGLLADNFGEGIVEVDSEEHYALMAGLKGGRGVRSWRERVRKLGDLGFITVHNGIGGRVGFVLIVHPHRAVSTLKENGQVPDEWWADYFALWMNVSGSFRRVARKPPGVPVAPPKSAAR